MGIVQYTNVVCFRPHVVRFYQFPETTCWSYNAYANRGAGSIERHLWTVD